MLDKKNVVDVKKFFCNTVIPKEGYRVNIIGFSRGKNALETNIEVTKKEIMKRFSVDKKATTYRVEFYKKQKFCGMILVRFKQSILLSK